MRVRDSFYNNKVTILGIVGITKLYQPIDIHLTEFFFPVSTVHT